jgi:predicted RND superfamily exporter protein
MEMQRNPMKKFSMVEFSINHPKWVFAFVGILTALFLIPFPWMKVDTNPKNMLPATSPVRIWNAEVEKEFGLYEDVLIVGLVNDQGIYNERTLLKIKAITDEVLKIKGVSSIDVSSLSTIDNIKSGGGSLSVSPLMQDVPKSESEISRIRMDLMSNQMLIDRIASRDGKTTAIYVPLEAGANGKDSGPGHFKIGWRRKNLCSRGPSCA